MAGVQWQYSVIVYLRYIAPPEDASCQQTIRPTCDQQRVRLLLIHEGSRCAAFLVFGRSREALLRLSFPPTPAAEFPDPREPN